MSFPLLPAKDFCLIRHGETTANRDDVIAGVWDVALTDKGRAQAQSLTTLHWRQPVAVFSSPLERAVETAALAFPEHSAQPMPELSERNWGMYEGRPLTELPPREDTPAKGEAWRDMILRVHAGITKACTQAQGRLPVMVCHSGVIRATRLLAGQPTPGHRPPNAAPILFRWTGKTHEETQHD